MDKCGLAIHKQVGTPTFMQQLIAMMNNKEMPKEIQMRIAYLIQKWGLRFDKAANLPIFGQVYDALRNKGVEFPPQIQ